ncbi:hypothetical protein HMPREF0663_11930 [Hoylesella oralis ATCC 33269]|uniref:Uncharacterized protein n=1 Tax=Hoylesella oralis ATCC 33269 TaxID=873533 RepID=E7RRX9_9BACT|nr:hypothetical protein HMPREF0663_11930 [Hoylesella oralis ATCC 33269]
MLINSSLECRMRRLYDRNFTVVNKIILGQGILSNDVRMKDLFSLI